MHQRKLETQAAGEKESSPSETKSVSKSLSSKEKEDDGGEETSQLIKKSIPSSSEGKPPDSPMLGPGYYPPSASGPSSGDTGISKESKIDFNQDFDPSPCSYEITEQEEDEATKGMSWGQKINYYIRYYLWMNYVDHILFVHLEKRKDGIFRLKKP